MFAQLKSRFVLWQTYRDTVRQLSALDRSILIDIGFERQGRADIKACARQAAREAACL